MENENLKRPIISVVMSVYNCEDFIKESIDSILGQTFRDFEFIIIDDCSTDNSVSIIESYNDKRIKLVRNEYNMRLPASLNTGIKLARGKYIARMDADDVSISTRFSKQVSYLEKHAELAVLGGSFQAIDKDGNNLYIYHAKQGKNLLKYYLMPSPIAHPTVMMRRDIIVKNEFYYDEQYSSAQDYDLWLRIIKKFKIDNLPDVLLRYRIQANSISISKRQEQQNNAYEIFKKNSPVQISYDELMAIMHNDFYLNPFKQAIVMYKVFHSLDYIFWRNIAGYAARYAMKRLKK